MAKIFMTGVTGFLGSNIAKYLINQGHEIIAIYRLQSSKDLCVEIENKIEWILQNDSKWSDHIIKFQPEVVIHCAWVGVNHQDRDDWEKQFQNVDYLNALLLIANKAKIAKFIALGSQAEYGFFNGYINETHPLNPTSLYGRVKVICSEIVKQYCDHNKIDWYWLRLFSFFGEGESHNWLLPTLVRKMFESDHMDLTAGDQQYSYLYVKDLGEAISNIIARNGSVGVYNIAGNTLMSIKTLIERVKDEVRPDFNLNFGKLPYRNNQPMHMQGDSTKFIDVFGEFDHSDFNKSLSNTIEYLKEKYSK